MINKESRILITGATGLIGSHIARRLWKEGYHNICATKRPSSKMDLLPDIADKLHWLEADVTDIVSLENCFEGIEVVIHAAAVVSYDPQKNDLMNDVNVGGTANMVNVALDYGVRRFVYISSVAALGKPEKSTVRNENTEWDHSVQTTDYAISKYKSEKEAWRGYAEGLSLVILNPSFVIGASNWTESSSRIWSQMAKGIPYYPMGTNGYVDVRDVSAAALMAMNSDFNGERFVLSAETISYKIAFQWIAEAIGVKVPSRALTPLLRNIAWRLEWLRSMLTGTSLLLTAASAKSTAEETHYDSDKSREILGMTYRPLKQSIQVVGNIFVNSQKEGKDYGVMEVD